MPAPFSLRQACGAMVLVVVASNVLVLFPINDWLTWGALPYPCAFLVSELTARYYGAAQARRVAYLGFAGAVALSTWLANPQIALASGSAFLVAQLLDIAVFVRWRRSPVWWRAPLCASVSASLVDSAIFWTVAFWGHDLPVLSWALGDSAVKLAADLLLLTPYRLLSTRRHPFADTSSLAQ